VSKINNRASLKNNEKTNAIRGAIQHRATWMALMFLEMEKAGYDAEKITRAAVRQTGLIHGGLLRDVAASTELMDFNKAFLTEDGVNNFEMDIKTLDDKELYVEFNYCALVEAWLKLGIDDEKIALLCDIAMDGDRGIAESMGYGFELGNTIAQGYKTCKIKFLKK